MRRVFLILALLALPSAAAANEAKATCERMIHRMRGHANVARYEMTVERPQWTRSIQIQAWDDRGKERLFLRILNPPKDQGVSFLKIGYNLWNYLPRVEKIVRIPPSMMLQPWMGSDFSNDDLIKESSYIDDYTHAIVGKETWEGEEVTQIELTPLPDAPVVWGKVVYWVRNDDLPVQQHFLNEQGKLIKDLRFEEFKIMDGVMFPTFWIMRNVAKDGQKTTLQLLEVDFDPDPAIADSVFTQRNLRS
jgi:negative regulator of sigma E activity